MPEAYAGYSTFMVGGLLCDPCISNSNHNSTYLVGFILLALSFLIAFTGYSIAFGNMSYWGISVILALAAPIDSVYALLLSGYTIGVATITKLFIIHFLLPFVSLILVVVHIVLLHRIGSSSCS